MSANYYLRAKPACTCYGREYERLHIGKSSAGWCFALRVYDDGTGPANLAEWVDLFPFGVVDEYGREVSPEEMLAIITERKPWNGRPLHRHQSREWHVIEYGGETYDLLHGEFS
jgi:hypothetical protein